MVGNSLRKLGLILAAAGGKGGDSTLPGRRKENVSGVIVDAGSPKAEEVKEEDWSVGGSVEVGGQPLPLYLFVINLDYCRHGDQEGYPHQVEH